MSDPRAIQRYAGSQQNLPAATVMTQNGPAIIQVIDMPGGLGSTIPYGAGAGVHKPGGINVLSAVLRRWWLVLLVTILVGGVGFVAADKFMKPMFEAEAHVRYAYVGVSGASDPAAIVRAAVFNITKQDISLIAAQNPELQQSLPWLRVFDLGSTADQKEVWMRLKDIVSAEDNPLFGTITIMAERSDGQSSAALANAYADALVAYIQKTIGGEDNATLKEYEKNYEKIRVELTNLQKQKYDLLANKDVDTLDKQYQAMQTQLTETLNKAQAAKVDAMFTNARLEEAQRAHQDPKKQDAEWQLRKQELTQAAEAADSILQQRQVAFINSLNGLATERSSGKKDDHPDVKRAVENLNRAQKEVEDRQIAIAAIIDKKITDRMILERQKSLDDVKRDFEKATAQLAYFEKEGTRLAEELRKMAPHRVLLQDLEGQVQQLTLQKSEIWKDIRDLRKSQVSGSVKIAVDEPAFVPLAPAQDKRTKVQAAGCMGGLFLGVLLALLIDKFDKRLRHPRDVEPLMSGAPVLGMIPKIQELKRIKGEQARNLIAEEFRVIRTQVLFGNPNLQYKTMCITSPTPGDGKTSLAVNLAISIAKAGRRTLLIDADIRKPDVHRIFNISEAPGFADLIHGTCEPGAAIRKSDIEMLDVLPAGLPLVRPSELLSRPETARLIAAFGELYDHVIFDSAPLLPVSDTHVLAGLVDGVICSFNAEVDRDTVKLVEEILRRSNARLIGSVMNQVKYKHTSSYQRGNSAYDSYYSSPRGAGAPAKPPVKTDSNVASLNKPTEP